MRSCYECYKGEEKPTDYVCQECYGSYSLYLPYPIPWRELWKEDLRIDNYRRMRWVEREVDRKVRRRP
jgi:hypothetical protein